MEDEAKINNMAGNAMDDYDLLEDRFCHLKKASVLVADYDLLRKDFLHSKEATEKEIDQWLLNNAAYFSDGQVSRLEKESMVRFGRIRKRKVLMW